MGGLQSSGSQHTTTTTTSGTTTTTTTSMAGGHQTQPALTTSTTSGMGGGHGGHGTGGPIVHVMGAPEHPGMGEMGELRSPMKAPVDSFVDTVTDLVDFVKHETSRKGRAKCKFDFILSENSIFV